MANLVVLAFDTETGADQMRNDLIRMQNEHIIQLDDAAVAVRNKDGKVKIEQLANLTGAGALSGAFWGFLIGLIFLVPGFGLLAGAAMGALMGHFTDVGVDDKFIKEVGNTIQPGNSALFLLVREATPDRVMDELKGKYKNIKVIKTSLSKEQEEKLRATFAA